LVDNRVRRASPRVDLKCAAWLRKQQIFEGTRDSWENRSMVTKQRNELFQAVKHLAMGLATDAETVWEMFALLDDKRMRKFLASEKNRKHILEILLEMLSRIVELCNRMEGGFGVALRNWIMHEYHKQTLATLTSGSDGKSIDETQ
jgi:hypothetical protein